MFYDHEQDGELTLGRRGAVADWGADAVFSHTARRRFSRAQTPRRASGPIGPPKQGHVVVPAPYAPVSASLEAAQRSASAVEPPVEPTPRELPAFAAEPDVAPNGRKTVTITGRPAALVHLPGAALERHRPGRTVIDRVGHRPDHVAAFAFALGLLLILVAVATAHAG